MLDSYKPQVYYFPDKPLPQISEGMPNVSAGLPADNSTKDLIPLIPNGEPAEAELNKIESQGDVDNLLHDFIHTIHTSHPTSVLALHLGI